MLAFLAVDDANFSPVPSQAAGSIAMAAMSARMISHSGRSLCGQEGSDFSCRPVGNSSTRLDIAEERLDATNGRGPFGAMAAAVWAWMHGCMPVCRHT